jgi:hypothetical protein
VIWKELDQTSKMRPTATFFDPPFGNGNQLKSEAEKYKNLNFWRVYFQTAPTSIQMIKKGHKGHKGHPNEIQSDCFVSPPLSSPSGTTL